MSRKPPFAEPSSPDASAAPEARSKRQQAIGRRKLLILFLVFSLPVAAAYYAYAVLRPGGHAALGELIQPPLPVGEWTATDVTGRTVPVAALKGQWLLVSPVLGACDPACLKTLYLHRQLRETLNKDKDRLDWVVLLGPGAQLDDPSARFLEQATVLKVGPDTLRQWLAPAPGDAVQAFVYVVDPLGNTMMRFPAVLDAAQAAKARSDLNRLLRASLNWDPPGR
jgi:hypothetical protein